MLPFSCGGPRGRVGEFIFGWAFVANAEQDETSYTYDISAKGKLDTYMPWPSHFFTVTSCSDAEYRDGVFSSSGLFSATYFQLPNVALFAGMTAPITYKQQQALQFWNFAAASDSRFTVS
jgi:hypothetical protein